MNSVLNPEAPEFYPHLTSVTQGGYSKVKKTIISSNNMPLGVAYDVFKTFNDFNIVTYQLSENVIEQTNQILINELPAVKLKYYDNEYNTEKITDANDSFLDKVNINIDTMNGVQNSNDMFHLNSTKATPWNDAPIITKIQMGSTVFIAAKNIPRPQLNFKDTIDNSENLWVPKISDKPNNIKPLALNILYNEDGEAVGYEHPYRVELDLYHPPSYMIEPDPEPPTFPYALDETKFTFVATEAALDALVEHLTGVLELAVDVEHHSYRTYQGITCLIQISTNEGGDFIIDTLAIREHIHKLNLVFTDPKKLKVFHGAENDVLWLQRDFGVYIVGLFDTHQAAKALNMPGLSLKHLLFKYCNFNTDKTYQLADWRIRPLPAVLVEYARTDTHYLLYVWRMMKHELLDVAAGQPHLLLSVFEESRQICAATYNKEVIHETSHIPLYIRSKKSFNTQQMAALKMLYKWRDSQAREQDESTTYLIPNHMLLALAEQLPREVQGVNACCEPMPPFIKQNLLTLHRMILSCRQLPIEPQLYQMPTSIRSMLDVSHQTLPAYDVHDLSQFPELGEQQHVKLQHAMLYLNKPSNLHVEVPAFVPGHLLGERPAIVSDLNVNAKLFIPPYDRYRKYRCLVQMEEIKEFKEKEAKVAAISKGNELIKKEVLVKLQQAQSQIKQEEIDIKQDSLVGVSHENDESDADKKIAQRKRKISAEKVEEKEAPKVVEEIKKDVIIKTTKKDETDLKPYEYKNANYKKFYDDVNNPKQNKTNVKKYKKK
ncbi:exosome component 10 isoform X2 [Manduca sexta]|uniref:Exosome complex component 10 homolog n=1 Tax=Manduca sexta TaxID=7130 RepID=A0A921ZIU4_MANSE|nr:exosome component 10 isoform X2 [Manduca sexta]KAG6458535.1 hypothetical protein O3G_MSEX010920 [Manduca sexta]